MIQSPWRFPLLNQSDASFKAVFIKSPHIGKNDSVIIDKPVIAEA